MSVTVDDRTACKDAYVLIERSDCVLRVPPARSPIDLGVVPSSDSLSCDSAPFVGRRAPDDALLCRTQRYRTPIATRQQAASL
ncbi:unnamed protein product [Gongylonema pulchrum]|uniref:DUF4113 domain-containing protein n=1 Tax=Gongylonema pulchrum TaxID=637853 RepID=A0A183EJF6_9BILA|nr:unnamed protein product [Gongylonema pulchrum]